MASMMTIMLIGISLSMDAFSLSLIYGMLLLTNKQKIILSLTVSIYHFFMPLIGLLLGTVIDNLTNVNIDIIASIILIYIGIDLIASNFKREPNIVLSKLGFILFGLSVSIDSLTLGIGLKALTHNYYLAASIFSVCSGTFTYLGLILGNILGKQLGKYSKVTGGLILIVIAIILFIK